MSIKESTYLLRAALERAARVCDQAAKTYRATLAEIPENPENALTEEAMRLLASHGFVVIHSDHADTANGALRYALCGPHEDGFAIEKMEKALAHLEAQRAFVHN